MDSFLILVLHERDDSLVTLYTDQLIKILGQGVPVY